MVRTRFTRVGKLFAGLTLLFYIASVTSQSGLLLLFIGLIGGCFAVNWTFARRNVRNLSVTAPRMIQLVEGERSREPWKVENPTTKHAENIELRNEAGLLTRLPLIKAKENVSVIPRLIYERRGVFPNAEVTLACNGPYGLLRATRDLQLPGELVVLPRVYETSAPAGAGVDHISGGKFRGRRRVNSGTNFAGVRGWQSGDSIKQVHWKSTARRDQLMVKTFEEELGGRLTILLDCIGAHPNATDNAVRAAASIGTASLQEGHHVEIHDSTPDSLRLAPFSDEGELLLRLARYSAKRLNPELEQFWRKSTVAIVGDRWNESWRELIAAARMQNRLVHVYLPKGETVPNTLDAELALFGHSEIHVVQALHAC
jgi:uncharacterized protein (DUF58 family)